MCELGPALGPSFWCWCWCWCYCWCGCVCVCVRVCVDVDAGMSAVDKSRQSETDLLCIPMTPGTPKESVREGERERERTRKKEKKRKRCWAKRSLLEGRKFHQLWTAGVARRTSGEREMLFAVWETDRIRWDSISLVWHCPWPLSGDHCKRLINEPKKNVTGHKKREPEWLCHFAWCSLSLSLSLAHSLVHGRGM